MRLRAWGCSLGEYIYKLTDSELKMQDVFDSVASVASWYAAFRRSCK